MLGRGVRRGMDRMDAMDGMDGMDGMEGAAPVTMSMPACTRGSL
jgi:hypothetical protein